MLSTLKYTVLWFLGMVSFIFACMVIGVAIQWSFLTLLRLHNQHPAILAAAALSLLALILGYCTHISMNPLKVSDD
jgi:putative flippase GtrA